MKKEKKNMQQDNVDTQENLNNAATEGNNEIAEKIEELADLKGKYDDLNDRYLRLNAEFDNYRKRTLKEKSELIKTAGERILIDLLPFADDFERAMKAINDSADIKAVQEGMGLIYEKFMHFLAQNEIKVIETEGQDFDTDMHEAVTTIPAPCEDLKGKIVDCVQKGYKLNDKVIRFPKVVVGE